MFYKKKFSLPMPEKQKNKYIWHPTPKISRTIPWGYIEDPDDKDMLLPVPEELELLEEAKKMRKRYSLRELANWLTSMTGRPISHSGLRNRINNEKRRKNKAAVQREIAKELAKALAKAEAYERKIGGSFTRDPNPDDTSDTSSGTV